VAKSNNNSAAAAGNTGQAKAPQRTYSSSSNAKGTQQQQQQGGRGGGGGGRGGVQRNHSARGGGGGSGSIGAGTGGRGGVQRHHSARGGGGGVTGGPPSSGGATGGGGGRGSSGNGVQRSHSLRGGGAPAGGGSGVVGGGRGVQRHSSGRVGGAVQRNPSGRGVQRNASGRAPPPKQGMIQRTASGRGGDQQQLQNNSKHHHKQPRSRSNSHDGSVASAGGGGSFGPKVDRTPWDEILLLQSTGAGDTELERSIVRHAASTFLECRGHYLQPLAIDPAAQPLPSNDATAKDKKSIKQTPSASLASAAAVTSSTGEIEYWTPHERCIWDEHDREAIIQEEMNKLWSYKPLEVNDETRWKARSLREAEAKEDAEAARKLAEEEQLRKAVGILNKLSWTTLDRMTVQFLETLGCSSNNSSYNGNRDANLSKEVVQDCMALILKKAMGEPHFAELYAKFSAKLTTVHRAFKRTLLSLCQEEFYKADQQDESQTSDAKDASAEMNDKKTPEEKAKEAAEQSYAGKLAKKHYIGLMQFIGELYRHKLMKGGIMIGCLERLFVQDDEEKLECFTKLMTTAGSRLQADVSGLGASSSTLASSGGGGGGGDDDDAQKEEVDPGTSLEKLWDRVYRMAGRPRDGTTPLKAPTLRIRFLLQDLIELKENDWVQRRKEEKAKTIAQIHKEVAEEEQAAANRNVKIRRSQSGGVMNVRRSASFGQQQQNSSPAAATPAAAIDNDGFTQVVSMGPGGKGGGGPKQRSSLRRAKSDCVPQTSSLQRAAMGITSKNGSAPPLPPPTPFRPTSNDNSPSILDVATSGSSTVPEYLEPSECGAKMKNILKEYFVGGDTADAVFSIEELVGAGHEGSIDRGAAVIQDGILLVMESKEEDVAKFLKVMDACLKPDNDDASAKIEVASLAKGLNDPLEFLRDVEIDAPLAASHLAKIVATWTLELQLLELDFILKAPEFFLSSGRPAEFLKLVLQKRPFTDDHVKVVETVMTEEERAVHANVREWIETT
jgi:MIF4G domain